LDVLVLANPDEAHTQRAASQHVVRFPCDEYGFDAANYREQQYHNFLQSHL
jgi:hypothetical protein